MAITLVASSNLAAAVPSGGNATLNWPTLQQGDVAVVFTGHRTNSGVLAMSTSGYTQQSTVSSGAPTSVGTLFTKVMGSTPDTTAVVSGIGGTIVETIAGVVLRGVDTTNILDATPTTSSGNSTNPDGSSITTVTDKAWVLSFAFSAVDDAAITVPSGYSNAANASATDAGQPGSVAVATKEITTAGAEDPGAWTNWLTGRWVAITAAIRPAPPSSGASLLVAFP